MSLEDDVINYYKERAPVYDLTAGFLDPEAEKLRGPIKQRYRERFRGRKVLEIACGSGYWTAVIGGTAESVLAIDINCSLLEQARKRCAGQPNICFQIADAYKLEGVTGDFNAAAAIAWWSHIPKKNIRTFLTTLHSKLLPGALVMFCDQLPYSGFYREYDADGNTIEKRVLPDGRSFFIVKNFPDEREIKEVLSGFAEDIEYHRVNEDKWWEVLYRVRG